MSKAGAKIGIVVRPGSARAAEKAREIVGWGVARGMTVLMEEESARAIGVKVPTAELDQFPVLADPIITLGGDGTLLSVARHVEGQSPLFLGVHFGHLGFLTEILPDEIFPTLEEVLAGRARFRERNLLLAEVHREGKQIFRAQVVNDAVIQKGARERLLDLDMFVNGEEVMRVRADGLIVATPTGSTAYSLAAGGSIAYPSLSVVLITPICPHALTSRPLVLDLESQIKIRVPKYEGRVFLTADGQTSCELLSGDEVLVSKGKRKLRIVSSSTRSYFDILRTKLNWGIGNKGE